MDTQRPLKNVARIYDPNSRFDRVDAVEWASERMIASLRAYVEQHKVGPESIFVKIREDSPYSPCLCLSRLKGELNQTGLTSKLDYATNGFPSTNGVLVFDLDDLADQYPGRRSCSD